jgi:hypothetical protein
MASTTSVAAASPLPSPLDGSISSNFTNIATSKCPAFLNSFLTNPTFKQCYPFSMLLQVSKHSSIDSLCVYAANHSNRDRHPSLRPRDLSLVLRKFWMHPAQPMSHCAARISPIWPRT